MKKKMLCILLALCTVIALLPVSAMPQTAIAAVNAEREYGVFFHPNNGSSYAINKWGIHWNDTVLQHAPEVKRTGYDLVGWECEGVRVTEKTTYGELAGDESLGQIVLTAVWKRSDKVTGTIYIGSRMWDGFVENAAPFYTNESAAMSVIGRSASGAVSIQYYIASFDIPEIQVSGYPLIDYTGSITLKEEGAFIVYAKLTDKDGNCAFLRSGKMIIDLTAPKFSGIADGKIYVGAVTAAVNEEHLERLTVNGKTVTPDENGRFVISPGTANQRITAVDKAGNTTTVTVFVADDSHTLEKDDGDCTTPIRCTCHNEIIVPAYASHSWDGGKIIKNAAPGVKGSRLFTCTECTKTRVEEIPALPGYMKGDVNNDGKITVDDARAALRASVKLDVLSEAAFAAADVDGKKGVTVDDARLILRVSVKLDTFDN